MTSLSATSRPALEHNNLLSLPAEIRIHILGYVFQDNLSYDGYEAHHEPGGILLDESYAASELLSPLLVCRQLHQDASLLSFANTHFVITSLFFNIQQRLEILHPKQLESIRSLALRADDRQFRKLQTWGAHPFSHPSLNLTALTIVLQRSSFWHYLFDFTADIVKLLRNLQNVKRFMIVRNGALVKGSFKTWYNRLVGLILKIDHQERYLVSPANPEKVWWQWSYDEHAQKIVLDAQPAKEVLDEESYMESILPLMEELRASVESEEWNPDPRARNHYY